MQPPVTHTGIPAREEDYRARQAAEPKSWVTDQPVEAWSSDARAWPGQGAHLYTHNAERFARAEAAPAETTEADVEPAVSPPPHWMIMIAVAAVAALMGALLGGFLHI
ncbi:hypothetical protein [Brevundimonas sp. SL130]|uniref:hypothetical protein n=1 Tax=Brevundimonas sp. SL130 TaxID=2995143 RepID=UPI00226CE0C5|nr:hypothetical protein [Brevundimonas sp. SL130]WAC60949.1 hypothetical protein OU998_05795 [Brevundimonas sp. SL130]